MYACDIAYNIISLVSFWGRRVDIEANVDNQAYKNMGDNNDTTQELKDYLEKHHIHDLFTKIVEDLLKASPDEPLQHIANYLLREHGVAAEKPSESKEAEEEVVESESESESEEEEEDDDYGELPEMKAKPQPRGRRVSVSAGVINYSKENTYKAPVFEKSAEDIEKIKGYLKKNTLFQHMDDDSVTTIIMAMKLEERSEGDVIIQEGDEVAEHYYILEDGAATVYKGEDNKELFTYSVGQAFGELALLYNQARAATIKATSDCKVWSLDQTTFKNIVVIKNIQRREKFAGFLRSVELLKNMTDVEVMTLADAMGEKSYGPGDAIVTEGDEGDDAKTFYIILSGEVAVTRSDKGAMGTLSTGDYFGELALMYNKPRAATCTASTDVKCLYTDRRTFQRILGPLGEIMERNMARYALGKK